MISRTTSILNVTVQDRTIIKEYSVSLGRISSNSCKQQMLNLIESYGSKVTSRDRLIQSKTQEMKRNCAEKSKIYQMLVQAQEEKSKLQSEKFRLKKEFSTSYKKEENKKGNQYLIKEKVLQLRTFLVQLEKTIEKEGKNYELNNNQLQEIVNHIKNIKKQLGTIRYSINKLASEEHTVHFQIEKVLEYKRKDMLTSLQELSSGSKESEEFRLNELKIKIDETTTEIEHFNKELNNFDNKSTAGLAVIDQEETLLKTQLQVIESALRNVELENKKIKDMEIQLAKLEETEAAPIPECLQDQTRSKSVPRIENSKKNENSCETKENEDSLVPNPGKSYVEIVDKAVGRHVSISTGRCVPKFLIKKPSKLGGKGVWGSIKKNS